MTGWRAVQRSGAATENDTERSRPVTQNPRVLSGTVRVEPEDVAAVPAIVTVHDGRSYLTDLKRMHRWARGDWQLLPWLWPRVGARLVSRRLPVLSLLDRWKILDNLRRSLVAPSALTMLLAGWMCFDRPLLATLIVAALAASTNGKHRQS